MLMGLRFHHLYRKSSLSLVLKTNIKSGKNHILVLEGQLKNETCSTLNILLICLGQGCHILPSLGFNE